MNIKTIKSIFSSQHQTGMPEVKPADTPMKVGRHLHIARELVQDDGLFQSSLGGRKNLTITSPANAYTLGFMRWFMHSLLNGPLMIRQLQLRFKKNFI